MAVDKLVDSTVLDGYFSDIATAIRGKNGSSDAYTPAQMPQAITDIPSGGGGGPVEEKDVNFIDYDGSIVYSYTAEEFLELSALPDNPTHTGLTAQGWNWTIQEAKNYVTKCGILVVGQHYITDSGDTRIYITLQPNNLNILLGLAIQGSVYINWGDGTNETITGTSTTTVIYTPHSYSNAGDYVICITVNSGSEVHIRGGSRSNLIAKNNDNNSNENYAYRNSITKMEIGQNVYLGQYAFAYCYNLRSITIPATLQFTNDYYASFFSNCYSLTGLVIPRVTTLNMFICSMCYNLKYISISPTVTSIYGSIVQGSGVRILTMPDITYLGSGFTSAYSLTRCSFSSMPASLANIAINNAYSLKEFDLTVGSITQLPGSFFYNDNSLTKVLLPDTLTSIAANVFYNCYCLTQITIPENVASIGTQAFANCYGLTEIHFKPTTPPTLPHSNVFANLPSSCVIYVPRGYLNEYIYATNYPLDSTYTYIEE